MSLTILFIEDEPAILDLYKTYFKNENIQILLASNGAHGIEIIKQSKRSIDCIVSDIDMPILNGIEVAKYLSDNNIKIPIIFVTGKGNFESLQQARGYGAFAFLKKPFTFKEIVKFMKEALLLNMPFQKNKLTRLFNELDNNF